MNAATTSSTSSLAVQKPAIHGGVPWPEASSIQQNFSLPSSIIYYMIKNPTSPIVYNKLIQSGKYFFEKNPILVVHHMVDDDDTTICSNEKCHDYEPCCLKIEINKILPKFWFTQRLSLDECIGHEHITSLLRRKTYRCDIGKIFMEEKHVLYDDFKFLASFQTDDVILEYVQMVNNDGKAVAFEDIIKVIPKIKMFSYIFCENSSVTTTPSTMKTIAKLMNPGLLKKFNLLGISSGALDVDDISSFLNDYKDTIIYLRFDGIISAEYKVQLDALIDIIIASKIPGRMIHYDEQDEEKLEILNQRMSEDN